MPSTAREGPSPGRYACLDGLRGVLACYVMLAHMAPFAWMPPGLGWVPVAISHGQAAVDVFFILSGLVIVQSLARCRGAALPFLRARLLRTYPAYIAALGLALLTLPLAVDWAALPWIAAPQTDIWPAAWPPELPARLLAHLTMTHGLLPDGVLPFAWISLLGAAWSLSTEWQFYALAACCGAALAGGSWRLRHLIWLLLGLAAAGRIWALLAADPWQFSRAFLPNKAQYFALGIASVGVLRGETGARLRYWPVLLACVLLSATAANKLLPPLLWTLVLFAQAGDRPLAWLAELLRARLLLWLGAISYSLYLINEPVQKLLGTAIAALAAGDPARFDALWLPGAVMAPLLAAFGLHRWVEAPWMHTVRPCVGGGETLWTKTPTDMR